MEEGGKGWIITVTLKQMSDYLADARPLRLYQVVKTVIWCVSNFKMETQYTCTFIFYIISV